MLSIREIFAIACLWPLVANGFGWELFESGAVPDGWSAPSGNSLSIDSSIVLQGEQSLSWDWTNTAEPRIDYTGSTWDSGGYVNSFSFWVHREKPLPEAVLQVSFLQGDTVVRSFTFGLDFTGWRTAFVPYRDMDGVGSGLIDGLRLEIIGESVPETGRLLVDQIIPAKVMDSRHQYADVQVPFVREGMDKGHWEPRVEELGRDPRLQYTPDEQQIAAGADLARALQAELAGTGSVTGSMVDRAEEDMADFGLQSTTEGVRGYHIFYNSYPGMAYPGALRSLLEEDGKQHDFREYGALQLRIARYYHRTDDPELRSRLAGMFTLMAQHLLNQGWAAGSNQGSIHHIGYQIREYFQANFLMRDVLADAGLLKPTREAVQWYSRGGELLNPFVEPNMDYYNTLSLGQLLGLLMEDDPVVRAAWLQAYQHTLSQTLATVMPGDGLGLKPDGTAFHHNGHYPAYAIGAFQTLGILFDHLRDTPFQPTGSAHIAFRRSLLAARIYSQKFDWPIGISGRHPFSGNIQSLQRAFSAVAAYPDPVTGITPDPEMSVALLRLWGNPGGDLGTAIQNAGLAPETSAGFWSFPFANLAVARGPGWMASMKGYSRYVWSSEIYTNDNRYGRYQSNGTLEILREGGRAPSGYREAGWDWNRLPGTTAIHLPFDQLESPRSSTLMLRSGETFAGAASRGNRTGIYGLIINEPFFGNDLKARKSVSMLGDVLVALGSGISSANTIYPTETTVFQVALPADDTPQLFGDGIGEVTQMGASGSLPSHQGLWFRDPVGTGYWLAPGQSLHWHRKLQQSFQNKTREATAGSFAAGWLNHGASPSGASYHFAVLPMANQTGLEEFHQDMQTEATAPYVVLSQTPELHAVYDNIRDTLHVAAFEAGDELGLPHLQAVSDPLLVVIDEYGTGLEIAVSNPDLKPRAEGHVLSTNRLLLSGLWSPEPGDSSLYWHEKGNTHIVVPTRAGITSEVSLIPAGEPTPFAQTPRLAARDPVVPEQRDPTAGTIIWEAVDSANRKGWIVEKLDPASGQFKPATILESHVRQWTDPHLRFKELVAYRITEWTSEGLGPHSKPVPVFLKEGFGMDYDFRESSTLDQLWLDGWQSSGISDPDADLQLAADGLLLTDNSPSAPAALTLPFPQQSAGSAEAVLGVHKTANFFVNLTLLHQGTPLMSLELTTRTEGVIETPTESVAFSDQSWDLRDGPPRKVLLSWQMLSSTEFSLQGTFYNLSGTPTRTLSQSYAVTQLPDTLRVSVGYGSAVNRGALVQRLSLYTAVPAETIPLAALPDVSRYTLTPDNQNWFLLFSPGPAPADYGLQLIGETSTDLSTWTPFLPDDSPITEDGENRYGLPPLDGPCRFYRFEMAP